MAAIELDEQLRKKNHAIINKFEKWLYKQKLDEDTIDDYICNIELFLNAYLVSYCEKRPQQAAPSDIEHFLGTHFIEKCLDCSKSLIDDMCDVIAEFYKFISIKYKGIKLGEILEVCNDRTSYYEYLEEFEEIGNIFDVYDIANRKPGFFHRLISGVKSILGRIFHL